MRPAVGGMSPSGGDLLSTGRVTKPAGKGGWGETVTPRWPSRLSIGRLRNTNRLIRVWGLKCHLRLHGLTGGTLMVPKDSLACGARMRAHM